MKEMVTSDIITNLKRENEVLKNRCKALSNGTLCMFCNLDCKHKTQLKAGGTK